MPALTFEQIRERIAARFGEAVGPTVAAKDPFVVVKGDKLVEISRFLRDEPELAFDYLIDETATDHPKENVIRLVYHLTSTQQKHVFKFKVECDRASPKAPTIDSVWHAANWLEREVYDLYGVVFEGHPDLRRIMMPDDWIGHPLRKDWQESGGYQGISNVRVSPLDLLLEKDKALRAEAAKNAPPPPPKPVEAAKPAEAAKLAEAAKPAEAAEAAKPAEATKPAETAKPEDPKS